MSGEALTTHSSLTMDLVLQLLGRYLHDGDAPMREFVNNSARLVPATSAAFDCESSPREYRSSAAATRISFTNSVGDKRSAESAPSGTSNVTVGMSVPLSSIRIPVAATGSKRRGPSAQTGASTPRELLPIVSQLSADT